MAKFSTGSLIKALRERTNLNHEAMPGFDEDVLMQFILSKKAQLWELQGKPPELIMPLIEQAITLTKNVYYN